jgi:hypothetical protein
MPVSREYKRAYLGAVSNNSVKREIGRRIVERIVKRTQSGIDKEGDKFTKYSKSYKKSLAFSVYGKSKSTVTLTLSGAMLSSVSVVGVDSTTVKIGFNSADQFKKAEGHIDGTGARNALPVRDFWGLPIEDQQDIVKEVIRDTNSNLLAEALDLVDLSLESSDG